MLLAESLLLCGIGAAIGVATAQPMVAVLARYASRFSIRALDFKVDSSLLWVGAALAVVAAVILAFVPRLPSKMIQHTFASCRLGRDLGEPNRGFRRFDLAEERPHAAELVVSPMLQEPGGLGCDLPLSSGSTDAMRPHSRGPH